MKSEFEIEFLLEMIYFNRLVFTLTLFFSIVLHGYSQKPVPAADHHLHIRSESASSALVKLQKEFSGNEIPELPPTGADQVIKLLGDGGIEHASLLSVAYFFGAPDIDFPNEYQKVKDENNYVSREAAKYPARLAAFCSVNPLANYALDEIKRCADLSGVAGLKLHLANSDVNLRNEEHVQNLTQVFEQAGQLDLSIIIHLFTRNPEYGKKDAKIFLEKILTNVPDLYVQIAHLGGAGLFDKTTEEVIEYFQESKESYPNIMDKNVVFDVSATVMNPEIALSRGDTARAIEIKERNASLIRKIEELETNRLLFGTDWVAVSRKPAEYAEFFRSLRIKPSTLEQLFNNEAFFVE